MEIVVEILVVVNEVQKNFLVVNLVDVTTHGY